MDIARANIDALNATLTVKVGKSDYESKVEATLRDYRRKAQIPGFRPGMVPMGVIRKMYQRSIIIDEVFKQVTAALDDYIKNNRLHILGEPLPNEAAGPVDFDALSEFEIVYDIALAPEVNLKIDKSIHIPYYTAAVTDDEVQQRIDSYRRYYGKTVSAEKIVEDALVRVDLTQNGETKHSVKSGLLSLKVMPAANRQVLLGLAAGDTLKLNVRELLTNDADCAAFLNLKKEQLDAIDPIFTLTVKDITHVQPAEVNQALFDEICGKDVVTSEEVFLEKIKAEIQHEIAQKSEQRFAADVRSLLMRSFTAELPEPFLKRWILMSSYHEKTAAAKVTPEEVEKDFPSFVERLRWQLIEQSFIAKGFIEVGEDDLLHAAKETLRRRLTVYGTLNMNDERLAEFAYTLLNRPEDRNLIFKYAIEHQVIEHVRSAVTLEQKEVTHEELKTLAAAS